MEYISSLYSDLGGTRTHTTENEGCHNRFQSNFMVVSLDLPQHLQFKHAYTV